jgi:hypothetical protein
VARETALGYREVMDRARLTPSAAILAAALLPATLVSEDAKANGAADPGADIAGIPSEDLRAGIEGLEKSVPAGKASRREEEEMMTEPR